MQTRVARAHHTGGHCRHNHHQAPNPPASCSSNPPTGAGEPYGCTCPAWCSTVHNPAVDCDPPYRTHTHTPDFERKLRQHLQRRAQQRPPLHVLASTCLLSRRSRSSSSPWLGCRHEQLVDRLVSAGVGVLLGGGRKGVSTHNQCMFGPRYLSVYRTRRVYIYACVACTTVAGPGRALWTSMQACATAQCTRTWQAPN